jgi:hypothetical protein
MAKSRRFDQAAPEQMQLNLSQPEPAARRTDERHCSPRSSAAASDPGTTAGAAHPPCHSAAELLQTPGAVLTRTHVRELGWERRGVDAIFRALPVVAVDGYSRPVIRVDDYLELIQESTFRDDRVRPSANGSPGPKLSTGSNGKRVG